MAHFSLFRGTLTCRGTQFGKPWLNTSTASPRYIRGSCLMLECRYGFRQGCGNGSCPFSVEEEAQNFYRFRIGYLT